MSNRATHLTTKYLANSLKPCNLSNIEKRVFQRKLSDAIAINAYLSTNKVLHKRVATLNGTDKHTYFTEYSKIATIIANGIIHNMMLTGST